MRRTGRSPPSITLGTGEDSGDDEDEVGEEAMSPATATEMAARVAFASIFSKASLEGVVGGCPTR